MGRDPTLLSVRLKASKTNPFRKSITLYVGKGSPDICPVSVVLAFLVVRGAGLGPLFCFKDGRLLTRQRFVSAVRDALEASGIQASRYSSHSFRIGAATIARGFSYKDSGPLEKLGVLGVCQDSTSAACFILYVC